MPEMDEDAVPSVPFKPPRRMRSISLGSLQTHGRVTESLVEGLALSPSKTDTTLTLHGIPTQNPNTSSINHTTKGSHLSDQAKPSTNHISQKTVKATALQEFVENSSVQWRSYSSLGRNHHKTDRPPLAPVMPASAASDSLPTPTQSLHSSQDETSLASSIDSPGHPHSTTNKHKVMRSQSVKTSSTGRGDRKSLILGTSSVPPYTIGYDPPPIPTFPRQHEIHLPDVVQGVNTKVKRRNSKKSLSASSNNDGETLSVNQNATSISSAEIGLDPVTGHKLASSKDNKEFHRLFPNVPADDRLIDDYACALKKDKSIRGRLWVSQKHLCFASFFSSRFHWSFADIVYLESKSAGFLNPNSIDLEFRDGQRCTFSSFFDRDTVFVLLKQLWDNNGETTSHVTDSPEITIQSCSCQGNGTCEICTMQHPSKVLESEDNLASSETEEKIGKTRDLSRQPPYKAPSAKLTQSRGSWRERGRNSIKSSKPSKAVTVPGLTVTPSVVNDQTPDSILLSEPTPVGSPEPSLIIEPSRVISAEKPSHEISIAKKPKRPVPEGPVDCGCGQLHAANTPIFDSKFQAPLTRVAQQMFSVGIRGSPCRVDGIQDKNGRRKVPASAEFFVSFMYDKRKVKDFMLSKWTKGGEKESMLPAREILDDVLPIIETAKGWHRRQEYIMPMTNPLGPKQTRAYVSEEVLKAKKGHYLCIKSSTRNPDIFDGIFLSHVLICLTHAGPRVTRLVVSLQVEFEKFSLLKTPIIMGAIDGTKAAYVLMDAEFAALHKAESQPGSEEDDSDILEETEESQAALLRHRRPQHHHGHTNHSTPHKSVTQLPPPISNIAAAPSAEPSPAIAPTPLNPSATTLSTHTPQNNNTPLHFLSSLIPSKMQWQATFILLACFLLLLNVWVLWQLTGALLDVAVTLRGLRDTVSLLEEEVLRKRT